MESIPRSRSRSSPHHTACAKNTKINIQRYTKICLQLYSVAINSSTLPTPGPQTTRPHLFVLHKHKPSAISHKPSIHRPQTPHLAPKRFQLSNGSRAAASLELNCIQTSPPFLPKKSSDGYLQQGKPYYIHLIIRLPWPRDCHSPPGARGKERHTRRQQIQRQKTKDKDLTSRIPLYLLPPPQLCFRLSPIYLSSATNPISLALPPPVLRGHFSHT